MLLRGKQTARKRRPPLGERTWGRNRWAGVDRRPPRARHGPEGAGWWEGELIVGKGGKSAATTLVERTSRYTLILGLPEVKKAAGPAGVLIDHLQGLPNFMRQGLTWDQGTEMAQHASVADTFERSGPRHHRPRQSVMPECREAEVLVSPTRVKHSSIHFKENHS